MNKIAYIARHGVQAYKAHLLCNRERNRQVAEARRLAPGTPVVACCGTWHPITHLPLRVPCCGMIYFQGIFAG